ncbi:glycosyltransferase family 4 protein [Luminiphilus syltensis]|uniref:glycosyltransferase family 4 protein n=1 Tax=Luminiphilus syltensis TaxID=1341119 RepID=UPI00058FCE2F|nr:glycosyltransferase family 4 protein [Luminiphilus syltensis]
MGDGLPRDFGGQVDALFSQESIDIAYFNYDNLNEIAAALSCVTICENHDVMHLRAEAYESFGFSWSGGLEKEEEIRKLRTYDIVCSISLDEANYLHASGLNNVCYLPPNVNWNPQVMPRRPITSGLIGSVMEPNIDGWQHFFEHGDLGFELVLAGPISEYLQNRPDLAKRNMNSTQIMGTINQVRVFYQAIHVSLSPVRFGSGLKIKVLEALAHGRSVVGTHHSFIGFPEGISGVVRCDDDFRNWPSLIDEAVNEVNLSDISDYVNENFSNQRCINLLKARL